MGTFAEAMKAEATHTLTTNGAYAKNTSGDALVDLFASIGALRSSDETRVLRLYDDAYKEDRLLATKILFYARDIRGGLGERKTFRTIIKHMSTHHPEALKPNLDLIGVYGRYDDLYTLVGTPLENDMWIAMKKQFQEDITNMEQGNAVSLLGKWIKSADTSSKESRRLGCLTAKKLGYSVYDFKRLVRKLRKHIRIVEALMSANKWSEIKYPEVPSRAMKIYKKAFYKHDQERFAEFNSKALKGEVKINSATLYPYDILRDIIDTYAPNYNNHRGYFIKCKKGPEVDVLEAQWRQLPNYIKEDMNVVFMADTSGSTINQCRSIPFYTSIGLAIYFAERNNGPFHGKFMTFSSKPVFQEIKGDTLVEKLESLDTSGWTANTNLEAAFDEVRRLAKEYQIAPKDMPRAIIVCTDMQIDQCEKVSEDWNARPRSWSFYEDMKVKFAKDGYQIPDVIFWNVNSMFDTFHADNNRAGVQLVSGYSSSIFSQVMKCIGFDAFEAMLKTINSERYDAITVA